jgi:hypothetical protein
MNGLKISNLATSFISIPQRLKAAQEYTITLINIIIKKLLLLKIELDL